jgi:chitodextrinase
MDATGAARFKFYWSAPETPGVHTLFISAVVGNGDQTPEGDRTLLTRVEVDVVDPSASLNEPPFAHIHVPSTALVGDAVLMNAARSVDADGNIVTYEWDFGDGTIQKLEQPTVEHKYASPGYYSPQLIVTDEDGLTGSAIVQVEIMDVDAALGKARPKADAGGPYVTLAAQEIRFNGGRSRPSHSKGQIVAYEWDFGDGSLGSGEAPTHIYDIAGSYIATLTVWDDRGLPNSAVAQVRVQEGESAKLGMFRVPSRIAIWDGEGVRYPFDVTVSVDGLRDGVTRCGVVYLKRNGEDYRHQTFCLTGAKKHRSTFEHLFANSDAPSVEWTAYAVLENGSESKHQTKTSKVIVFPMQRK